MLMICSVCSSRVAFVILTTKVIFIWYVTVLVTVTIVKADTCYIGEKGSIINILILACDRRENIHTNSMLSSEQQVSFSSQNGPH